MARTRLQPLFLALFALLFVGKAPRSTGIAASKTPAPIAQRPNPLRFEANVGQVNSDARFIARRGAASLALSEAGVTLDPRGAAVSLKVAGGHASAPVASDLLPTKTNYLLGKDPAGWHTDVANYGKVTYPSVRDGVDLVFHGEEGQLEYDFVVAPGADASNIAMEIEGGDGVSLTKDGDLAIHLPGGDIVQKRPRVYQRDANGAEQDVVAAYRVKGREIGFNVAAYDTSRALVIDPVVEYSTYVGGAGYDQPRGVAMDDGGNSYVVGALLSPPVISPSNLIGPRGNSDIFVLKRSPSGTPIFTTYIGGTLDDAAAAVAVDADGRIYVAGRTESFDIPVPSALNATGPTGSSDAYVAILNPGGSSLAYGSYLDFSCGGTDCVTHDDDARGIAVNGLQVYVGGNTNGTGLGPVLGVSASPNGAYAYSFTIQGGPTFKYKTYLSGGSASAVQGIAVDAAGNAYVAGGINLSTDVNSVALATTPAAFEPTAPSGANGTGFFAKLAPNGTLVYASYTPHTVGAASTNNESAYGVAVDSNGHAYVGGCSDNPGFRTTSGAYQTGNHGNIDAFALKVDPGKSGASSLVYATLVGGSLNDGANAIAVDDFGNAFLAGTTQSTDYPIVAPSQTTKGFADAFVTQLAPAGNSLLYSYLFGGNLADSGSAIAIRNGKATLVGDTSSMDFPLHKPAQSTFGGVVDGIIVKLAIESKDPLTISPAVLAIDGGKSQVFIGSGGNPSGYLFSLIANQSGATISQGGAYVAGTKGGDDIVLLTDGTTASATATIKVKESVPPGDPLSFTGPSSVAPREETFFTVSGGVPPYLFESIVDASRGKLYPHGRYVAGIRGNVVDQFRITDGAGTTLTGSIRVTAGVVVSPEVSTLPPKGTVQLTARGGAGGPYTWIVQDGGTVTSNGLFTAPASKGTFTVTASDRLYNSSNAQIVVGGGVVLLPPFPSIHPGGEIAFSGGGGKPPYTFTLLTTNHASSIDAATGLYKAGIGNVVDEVEIRDSVGNKDITNVEIGPYLFIEPRVLSVESGAIVRFSTGGGTGRGYAFSVTKTAVGSTISADGVYTAGVAKDGPSDEEVTVRDSSGTTASTTFKVIPLPQGPGGTTSGGTGTGTSSGGTTSGGASSSGQPPQVVLVGNGNPDGGCATAPIGSRGGTGWLAGLVLGVSLLLRRRVRAAGR